MSTGYWIGVVSLSHVQKGVAGGYAQLGHGKAAPLRRLQAGDWFIYYSPKTDMEHGE
ncbi:MAG TPA: EVE domain-containing protein, partial [Spirochaetia bacterium]|nr:EVE domain-containing protein [Spirochaetia bacterium]